MAVAFDKLYWTRLGFAVLAGFLADFIFGLDVFDGILMGVLGFLGSYYVSRYAWYRNLEAQYTSKMYTTGIGGYVMIFLFTWILLFTLSHVGV